MGEPVAGRLKILQVGAFAFPAPQGSQVLLAGTARALRDAGHDVIIACYGHGRSGADGAGDGIPIVRARGVPGYRRSRSGPDVVKPLLDGFLSRSVARLLRDWRPHLVHAHNHEAVLACRAAITAVPGARLVYGEHTAMAEELPTYGGLTGGTLGRRLGRVLDLIAPKLADGAVALWGGSGLCRTTLCPVAVVPPGVEPREFAGVRPRRAGPGRWLVYAGTLDAFQDLASLSSTLALLPGWRLLIVTHAQEAAPTSLPVGATVVRAPDWSAARDWIAGADVAVVPRRHCRGFPMKLLNYAALGLRTVVSPGCARGVPGEVVARGTDPVALADAVLAAHAAGPLDAAVVLDEWGWPRRVSALLTLYSELCVTSGPNPP